MQIARERPGAAGRVLEVQRDIAGLLGVVADAGVGVPGRGRDIAAQENVLVVIPIAGVGRDDAVGAQSIFDVVGVRLRSQPLQGEQPLIVRAPLRGQGDGGALLLPIDGAPAQIFGHENSLAGRSRTIGAGVAGVERHGIIAVDRDRIRAVADVGHADVGQQADLADAGLPTIGRQDAARPETFFGQVAVVVVGVDRQQRVAVVEGNPGPQIGRAGDTALDHVRRDVLVDVHAGEQVRRHVFEAEPATVRGREDVAAIGL